MLGLDMLELIKPHIIVIQVDNSWGYRVSDGMAKN